MELPSYVKKTVCKKCGHNKQDERYIPPQPPSSTFGDPVDEYIYRECMNCGHSWRVRTLDNSGGTNG